MADGPYRKRYLQAAWLQVVLCRCGHLVIRHRDYMEPMLCSVTGCRCEGWAPSPEDAAMLEEMVVTEMVAAVLGD